MATLPITGVTRFLGGAVLERILHQETRLDLLLLMRADSPEAGLERVKENMYKFNAAEEKLAMLHPQHTLLGDFASPEYFLNDLCLDQVTHVPNCVAVASLGSNPLIWKVNIEGMLRLAQQMTQAEGLQRFLHAGIAMSRSSEPDSLVVGSVEFWERAKHLMEYTHPKPTIGQLMQQHCPILLLVIARPSIVMGHTRHGCRLSSSVFRVFSMRLMLRKFLCSVKDQVDVIPVNYYADVLLMLLNQPLAHGEVVYISAGEENSVRSAEIDQAMAQALEQVPMGDKYAQASYDALVKVRRELKGIFGPCNRRLMLKAIRLYGALAMLDMCFSNDKLLSMEVPKPSRFTDYIDRYVRTTRGLSILQQMAVDSK